MRTKKGVVKSNKMTNTVSVSVSTYKTHKLYHKRYRVTKTFYADTQGMTLDMGQRVLIEECRPLSKLKRWKVVEVLAQ